MIKQIYDIAGIKLTDSWYGKKIRAYLNAYGAEYDFCRLFRADSGGYILAFYGTMTADGAFNSDELAGFVNMLKPVTVEVGNATPLQLDGEYKVINKTMIKGVPAADKDYSIDVKKNTWLNDVYAILKESFALAEYDTWYVDISHRIRHKVSSVYLYEQATATELFDIDGYAFLSHIATAAEARGKGLARKLLYYLADYYNKQGKEMYLYAKDSRVSFYESIGFQIVSNEVFYEKTI